MPPKDIHNKLFLFEFFLEYNQYYNSYALFCKQHYDSENVANNFTKIIGLYLYDTNN